MGAVNNLKLIIILKSYNFCLLFSHLFALRLWKLLWCTSNGIPTSTENCRRRLPFRRRHSQLMHPPTAFDFTKNGCLRCFCHTKYSRASASAPFSAIIAPTRGKQDILKGLFKLWKVLFVWYQRSSSPCPYMPWCSAKNWTKNIVIISGEPF